MIPFFRKLSTPGGFLALLSALVLILAFGGFGRSAAQPSPTLSFDPSILLKQFQAAQRQEMNGLLKHEKADFRQLKSEQVAQQKSFDRDERAARRKFFAADHPGPQKRAYMKDLIARREALHQQLSAARAQAKQDSDERVRALRDEQQMKLGKFRDEIQRNQRPDDSLWPQPTLETD